jgi:glycosyltransferase involved in cell wall biosynthesis
MISGSVVIPITHRQPELLERLLDALGHQDLAPDEFEIIVCDDAGSEETRAQVERWRETHPVAIMYVSVPTPDRGPAAMRNAGWRAARGDVIAFTDDDAIPEPDWLRQGIRALADDAADAASGRIVVPLPDEPTDYELDAARLASVGFVTANCFCRRSVLQCIGGFDPRFRSTWRDGSDLFFRLISAGLDVVEATNATVVYPVRPVPWGGSLRAESKHMFDALLYKKHPRLYAEFIRPDRPYLYYAILIALVIAVIGVWKGADTVTAAGLATWLSLTAALAFRRLRATKRSLDHVAEVVVTSVLIPFVSVYHRVRGGVTFRVAFW